MLMTFYQDQGTTSLVQYNIDQEKNKELQFDLNATRCDSSPRRNDKYEKQTPKSDFSSIIQGTPAEPSNSRDL